MHRIFDFRVPTLIKRCLRLCLATLVFSILLKTARAQSTMTIPAGSYIIDMGITPQTTGNALKPYGLLYNLLAAKIPVIWSINPSKLKDGVDFTIGNRDFKGGPFIVEAQYRTTTINNLITTWQGLGVQGYTTTAPVTVPVFVQSLNQPRWTLDLQNGSIAVNFFTAAGIPDSAYGYSNKSGWKLPGSLTCCDDIFVMPHADPKWWATYVAGSPGTSVLGHGNLYNWNLSCKGAIWLGCHAGSALNNMYNPFDITQQTNFLTTKTTTAGTGIILPVSGSTAYAQNSLILWGSHAGGTIPYNTNTGSVPNGTLAPASDPVSQFMGTTDLAQLNGSEQIYLPTIGNGWLPSTNIITYDPSQFNVTTQVPPTSNGTAALIAYGHGFGNTDRGLVMMEASHNISGTAPANIAAMRAFFNFSMLATYQHAVVPTMSGLPSAVNSGQSYSLAFNVPPPASLANYTATWSSSCGGTFLPSNTSLNPTFIPPTSATPSTCIVSVTIRDDCNRVTFNSVATTVQCNLQVTPTITNVCFNPPGSTGAITMDIANGVGPYTYSWTKSGGGSGSGTLTTPPYTISGLTAGTYNVTVTANDPAIVGNGDGCPVTFSATISTSPQIVIAATPVPVLCNGGSTGAINVTVSGGVPGYTYDWADLSGTNDPLNRSGLPAGTYFLTVTDSKGCVSTQTAVTITQPIVLSAVAATSNVNCFGQSTGAINITPSGGVSPYTYLWNDGATTQNRTGLPAGTYSVVVTDANGCTYTVAGINVTQPAAGLSLSEVHVNPLCYGLSTGSINLTVTGGTVIPSGPPSYTYAWTKTGTPGYSATTEDISGLSAGTYNVTVTDNKGCSATLSVTITQPALLTLSTVNTRPTCPPGVVTLGNNGAIDLTISGGTGPFTKAWTASNGGIVPAGQAANEDLTLLVAGTYSVLVTDANGCTANTSVVLTNINPNPVQPGAITH